jgi:hypothetical protein
MKRVDLSKGVVLERRESKPLSGIQAFARGRQVVIVATDRPGGGKEQAAILSMPVDQALRLADSLKAAAAIAERQPPLSTG